MTYRAQVARGHSSPGRTNSGTDFRAESGQNYVEGTGAIASNDPADNSWIIHYYYDLTTIIIEPRITTEVRRVFVAAASTLPSSKAVYITWSQLTAPQYAAKVSSFGKVRKGEWNIGFQDTYTGNDCGQAGSREFNLNPGFIETQVFAEGLGAGFNIIGYADSIAHETWHVIGGISATFHYTNTGFIDSKTAKIHGNFSADAVRDLAKGFS
jgi:hypothetical protein